MIKNKYFVYTIIPSDEDLEKMTGRWQMEKQRVFILALLVEPFSIDFEFYRPSKFLNTKISTLRPIDSSIIEQTKLKFPGIVFELHSISNPAIDDTIEMLYRAQAHAVFYEEDIVANIVGRALKKIQTVAESERIDLTKRGYKEV